MKRTDCDIARDLMPLSMDGVCSEGSQQFLDEHVAACEPCNTLFAKMKAGMPALQAEPTQESQALQKGLRHLGKKFKALLIALAVLSCVVVLAVTASCAHQAWWNKTEWAPLDSYNVTLYRNDALVSMNLSGSFYEQVYNSYQQDRYYFTLKSDGEEYVSLTYLVSWYPNQHQRIANSLSKIRNANATAAPTLLPFKSTESDSATLVPSEWNSDYRFTTALETHQLCVDNGHLYMIDGWDSVQTTTGRTLLVPQLGTPVYEVRLSDGKNTSTIYYSWKNDEIPNYNADLVDEHGLPQSGIISPSELDKFADLIVK